MLYHPDDPLITWLRDGHLGGITPGSSRGDVLEKWGESSDYHGVTVHGFPQGETDATLEAFWDRHTGRLGEFQLRLGDSRSLRFPAAFGPVPFVFSKATTEQEFFDWMEAHRIEVRLVSQVVSTFSRWNHYQARRGVGAIFRSGFLFMIFQTPRESF